MGERGQGQAGDALLHALIQGQVGRDGGAGLVGQAPGAGVGDPAVHAPPAGEDPQAVGKAKVLVEGGVHDRHRSRHKGPAPGADVAARAAGADIVVISQVDVKYQLPLDGRKAGGGGPGRARGRGRRRTAGRVSRPAGGVDSVDGADVDLGGDAGQDGAAEGGGVLGGGGEWGGNGVGGAVRRGERRERACERERETDPPLPLSLLFFSGASP